MQVSKNELEEDFNSLDLSECMEYFKKYDDSEPLKEAVNNTLMSIKDANDKLNLLIEHATVEKNSFLKRKLNSIKNTLNQ
jgi:arginyl-tRNA synthetase